MPESALRAAQDALGRGQPAAALEHMEVAFTRCVAAGQVGQAADVLRRIGALRSEIGDLEGAEESFELSLCIARANALEERVAYALIGLATVEQRACRLDGALALYDRAAEVANRVGDPRIISMIEQNTGAIANVRGDLEGALAHYRAALECAERNEDDYTSCLALHNMGMAYVDMDAWEEAGHCFDGAALLAARLEDVALAASVELNRAELHLRCGSLERARACCDAADGMFRALGLSSGSAEVEKLRGILAREEGNASGALESLGRAEALARECGDRLLVAESLAEVARVHEGTERSREALQALNSAHRIFSELHAGRDLMDLDRRLDGLEGTYLRVVRSWGESIESKDPYTAGHCERVANYACMLAEAVGISGRDLTWLRMGGYLHDVGKIAVPLEILNKPGRLTEEEFAVIRSHTVEGDTIVAELGFPWDIGPVVRSHHERWDGSGYPDGLAGEEIPLTARILCVADVYDALTSARSYRAAMSSAEALLVMERDSGALFDPRLFDVFRTLIARRCPGTDERFPMFAGARRAVA